MRGTGGRRDRRGYKLRDGQAFSGLGCVGRVFQAGGGGTVQVEGGEGTQGLWSLMPWAATPMPVPPPWKGSLILPL